MANPNPKSVDPSLWWEPFSLLLDDLDNISISSDLPPAVTQKLKDSHGWFVDTVSLFKPPNEKSKEALNSPQLKIGSHLLNIEPELKDKALEISPLLCLDEVQSYILVERSIEKHNVAIDSVVQEFQHVILLQYYMERQCLLKCTRRILVHALSLGNDSKRGSDVLEEASKLFSDGLEGKLISVFEDLLSSSHPNQMDVDLFTLWAEETLVEENLVLDILFLAYYESFCNCNGERWKKLCLLFKGILCGSYNFSKLEISSEALHSSYQAKVQLLLILIETLDLENLLQMVHDEKPFGQVSSRLSLTDVQEMDAVVSSFNVFETKEAGPLILSWAVFLCLVSSLPGKEENSVLLEIDHTGYVRQAFEAAPLRYFLEIVQSDLLNQSDGPVAGYRSVLRTFISAFIASYEINLQLEDSTLNSILDILCKVYRGEESLCIQFWDRESFIDGPIRCLLCNLEGEFPFRNVELLRLLSSLSEGTWAAECVYNFLDKSVGVSSLFEITDDSMVDPVSQIVKTHIPLHVPDIEGLLIPSNSRGHILKLVSPTTALVRWEYTHSGVHILLMRLAQDLYNEGNEEVLLILDLLNRLVSYTEAACLGLMSVGSSSHVQENADNGLFGCRIWVVEILCTLVRKLSSNSTGAAIMAISVNILAKMLKCCPSYVAATTVNANIFDVGLKTSIFDGGSNSSSGSWMLSGQLATMLLIDCEKNDYDCPLAEAVLDFTMQLMETGFENDTVLALVVFSLQYILVNHEYWKYKVKSTRWRITLKVLGLIKKCVTRTSYTKKLDELIWDMLVSDSSIHSTLFRIVCTTSQSLEKLYISRLFDIEEIEGLSDAICSVLDILFEVLGKFSKDTSPGIPIFLQSVLSSATRPISVVAAVVSLISYFRNTVIQIGAAKVLSMLLMMADLLPPYVSASSFGLDDRQVTDLKQAVKYILLEEVSAGNEDLLVATVNLLTAAARYQPAFFVAVFSSEESKDAQPSNTGGVKLSTTENSSGSVESSSSDLVDTLLSYVADCHKLINNKPNVLLNILNFLKALWQRAAQYINILEKVKGSEKFWKQLCESVSLASGVDSPSPDSLNEAEAQNLASRYQCQSVIMEIMAYDMFLKKKLVHAESLAKQTPESKGGVDNSESAEKSKATNMSDHKHILSMWQQSSVLLNLIKSLASYDYDDDTLYRAKVSASLVTVHLIAKVAAGDVGSLSVSTLEKISIMSNKLKGHPAFSELSAQYSQRGYSKEKELYSLLLSDLYYHLEGELDGRKISAGPFKELSEFLVESKVLQHYQHKFDSNIFVSCKDVYLFDPERLRADLGSDLWGHLKWKASKEIAERMLDHMIAANSIVLLRNSKLSSLKSLITVLTIYGNDLLGDDAAVGGTSKKVVLPCIDHICECLHAAVESLAPFTGSGSENAFHFLSAQAELLLHLMRSAHKSLGLSVCIRVLKTLGSGLRVLTDFRPSATEVNITVKLLLVLLLSTLEFSCLSSEKESVEDMAVVSNVCLGLLPILCKCISTAENCTLALTTIDLILRSFLTPNSWFPIIQSHLQLQYVISKLQDKSSLVSVPIVMKFLLTLAHVREGAEMLVNFGFLSSLRFLFEEHLDRQPVSIPSPEIEKPQQIWGLALAVITAMVQSLGDSSSCRDILQTVIPYLFSEKTHIVSYYLRAPEFPSDDRDKKRPRAQKSGTSLTALKETEHTLVLMCVLARHWKSWVKAMKETGSLLREQSIHLLAFLSKGTQRLGDSSGSTPPLLCPPFLKEEFDYCNKPSFINSRNGWFALTPLGCPPKPKPSTGSTTSTALIVRPENACQVSPTHFSDTVSLEIYRIAFLLLKFLCLQAEGAIRRAEEVGYIDLAHFPELPMPDILHGLQDQAISIVSELCEANKLKQIPKEVQSVCRLLLQIMEMALYLELCVLQICGMRPVLGRVEDFSKEVKKLMRATEGHAFLKSPIKSVKQIISFVYPGLVQTEEL